MSSINDIIKVVEYIGVKYDNSKNISTNQDITKKNSSYDDTPLYEATYVIIWDDIYNEKIDSVEFVFEEFKTISKHDIPYPILKSNTQ